MKKLFVACLCGLMLASIGVIYNNNSKESVKNYITERVAEDFMEDESNVTIDSIESKGNYYSANVNVKGEKSENNTYDYSFTYMVAKDLVDAK